MIKMQGGEIKNRNENMPKKKKRGFLERAIEGITGVFIALLSSSATTDVIKGTLLISGILLILYAVSSD
jgi:hypothetical protein